MHSMPGPPAPLSTRSRPSGSMVLCADARVAVELDGAQHLADRAAYRRDRCKDQLLQESGYLLLRFLAEDLGRDLDAVLDAILRALSHRTSSGSVPLQFIRGGRT